MMHAWAMLLLLAALVAGAPPVVAAGAGAKPAGDALAPSATPVVVTDLRGRRVHLPRPAQRIITLLPSLTEAVCALQACDRLVGIDRHSDWPAAIDGLPRLGGLNDTSVEAIVALRPDVVLLSPATRLAGRLEALGIKAVVLDAERIEQVHDKLTVIAALIGRPAAGQRLWADIEAQIAAAVATVPAAVVGRTVYFEVSSEPFAAGPDSFVGEMLSRLGMKNIVPADLGPFPQVNPEFIVRSAPQIIMTVRDELARMSGRPGWAALPALRDAHTCGFAPETYRWLVRPGPRLGQAIGQIAQCLQALAPSVADTRQ